MRSVWIVLAMMTIAATNLSFGPNAQAGNAVSVRLAIYYGYPSLVNEARGDVEKAASVFSAYDVVVLGDGLEFADVKQGRYPEGDPGEHLKSMQIIAAVRSAALLRVFTAMFASARFRGRRVNKQSLSPTASKSGWSFGNKWACPGFFWMRQVTTIRWSPASARTSRCA